MGKDNVDGIEKINIDGLPELAVRLLSLSPAYIIADDVDRREFVAKASTNRSVKAALRKVIGQATADDFEAVQEWIDQHKGNGNSSRLYWIILLLDELDLLPSDPGWNRPERLVRRLARVGSYRMASSRMWACRHLADMPDAVNISIPALLRCVDRDPDMRVRAWAATALHCLGFRDRDWAGYIHGLEVAIGDEIEMEAALSRVRSEVRRK
jgi:hypothetical protein